MVLVHQKLILLMAFIAVLVAFSKIKSGYHYYGSKALRRMTYGVLFLIFGSAVGLIGSTSILGPGYSKSLVYFILESVVGYIAGWSFIIWGMAEWLPYLFSVSSRLQKKSQRLKVYESTMKVLSYSDASPATFNRIASTIIENYGYQAASLHIPDKAKRLSLFAAVGLTKKSRELISVVQNSLYNRVYSTGEVFQADETNRIHKGINIETKSGPAVDALAMPVDFGANRIGVMTLYTDHPRVFARDELEVLDAVSSNLGLAFYKDGLQKSVNANKSFKDFIAVILKTSRADDNFNSRMIRLAKLLKQYMRFDKLHLYLASDGAPQMLDFNLGGNSRLIVEKGFLTGDVYKPVKWVINKKRSLVLPDELIIYGQPWKLTDNMRILYTPVVVDGEIIGVLAVYISRSHHVKHNDKIVCDAISTVISGSLLEEKNVAQTADTFDRIGAIKYSIETALNDKPSKPVYRELARIIVEKMPATFCRIMLLNPDGDKFLTAAIYQRRELSRDERAHTDWPLSELHFSRKVITTGKPALIKQTDNRPKISEPEMKLLLPEGISQCIINPIIINGDAQGVVVIGENRRIERNQIGSNEMVFALLLTSVISMFLRQQDQTVKHKKLANTNRLVARRLAGLKNQAETFDMIDGFNSRLNGPLAGILASCEFMKSNPKMTKEQLDKYLNVIDRNARRIHKLSGQFVEARRSLEKISGSLNT